MEPQKYDSQFSAKSASPEATEKSSLSVFTLSDEAVMKNVWWEELSKQTAKNQDGMTKERRFEVDINYLFLEVGTFNWSKVKWTQLKPMKTRLKLKLPKI